VANAPESSKTSQTWDSRDESIAGPRVNIDLTGATPAEVHALLNRLAVTYGVAPYQAPASADLPDFRVVRRRSKDGQITLDLHARQVSTAFLDELLVQARKLAAAPGGGGIASTFKRERDDHAGPKVDAIFEGLSLQDLESRVREVQARGK
jgi:hypothetical protein